MNTVKHTYSQSAEALYAALTDADHLKRRAEAAGHRNVEVKIDPVGDGCRIRIARDIESEIPAIAKKVINPVNHVVTEFEWKKSGDGWTGSYLATVNPRIRVKSKLAIRPSGSGSEYVDDYTAEVDVPLIGKKIAALVEKETATSLKSDMEWTARDLG